MHCNDRTAACCRFSAQIIPPCASTIPLLIESPRPVPADVIGTLHTVEFIKDTLKIFGWDADAPVGDGDFQACAMNTGVDFDRGIRAGNISGRYR